MRRAAVAVAAASVLLSACGGEDPEPVALPVYEVVREGDIRPGDLIPAPTGEVVLTVDGDVGSSNTDGDGVAFDLATLDRLRTVAYTISDDLATGRNVRFEGVLLDELLALVGADADATNLHTVALNDYAVDIPVSDAHDFPVLVATRADGQEMPIADYGPIRVVYPYDLVEGIDPITHDPRWIWQLAAVTVE